MNWPLSLNKPAVSQQLGQLIYSYPYSWDLEWSVYVSIPLSLKMQIKANKRGFNFSSSLPRRLRPVIYSCSVRRGQLLVLARSAQQSRSGLSVEMFVSFAQKQTHENEVCIQFFSSIVEREDMSHHLCPLLCCVSSATRCSSWWPPDKSRICQADLELEERGKWRERQATNRLVKILQNAKKNSAQVSFVFTKESVCAVFGMSIIYSSKLF